MVPTFTVLIGSIGRPTLGLTLESIARQEGQDDQAIIVIDSFEQGARPEIQGQIQNKGFEAYAYDSGYHWLGVEQINWALRNVPITGSHMLLLGDDDVFVDDLYQTIRPICAAYPHRAILWKFVAPWRTILPDQKPWMTKSHISGCCIAAPYEFVGLHNTAKYPEHDFDWMTDVIARSGRDPVCLDYVGVIARPPRREHYPGVYECKCGLWKYLHEGVLTHCACGLEVDLKRKVKIV